MPGDGGLRLGGKRLFMGSLVLFTVSSVLCAFAWDLNSLIVFRVLQGVAGGALMPAGQILLVRAAGPHRMGRVMSVIGVPILLAPVLGPVLGGLILKYLEWEWIFLVNVPVGIIGFFVALRLLPADDHAARTDRRKPARCSGWRLSIVEPRNASSCRSPCGSAPRCCSKSPTIGSISTPGNSPAIAALASFSTAGSTSNGTNRRSVPAACSARSSRLVFSDVPLPSSMSVRAPVTAAISGARSVRIARSVRVG